MRVTMRAPDDFHVHFRQPPLLTPVVRETARWFRRALVMPNTVPPVTTPQRLQAYRQEILTAIGAEARGAPIPGSPAPSVEPLLTFKLVPEIDSQGVGRLAEAGAIGGKLYPRGVTTNSDDGVDEIDALLPAIAAMEEHGLVLEIHAESPGVFSLDREAAYIPTIERLVSRFPALRIVIEHVSSSAMVTAVRALPDTVAATVTVHHLLLTLDDVIGGELRPHHFCKPVAKRAEDRRALLDAVLSGDPRFFFGSDSAPHPRSAKEADCGCAGIYTAPVAVPLLAELFERADVALTEEEASRAGPAAVPGAGASNRPSLEAFLSRYGAHFYGLPLNTGRLELVDREWTVPEEYAGVVPFYAGARLHYDRTGEESHES